MTVSSIEFPLIVLDAATTAGTVALFTSAGVVASKAVPMGASRDDGLLPAIDALCREAGIPVGEIRTIVCGNGPGSFTSLRIAASIAKGIAHANAASLFAVSSLALAAANIDDAGAYLVHSDAMRGERYAQHVNVDASGMVHTTGPATRLSEAALAQLAGDTLQLIGVVSSLDVDSRAIVPDAARFMRLAEWQDAVPVDLARWEPDYGRLAEAQVKWESAHGRPLPLGSA